MRLVGKAVMILAGSVEKSTTTFRYAAMGTESTVVNW